MVTTPRTAQGVYTDYLIQASKLIDSSALRTSTVIQSLKKQEVSLSPQFQSIHKDLQHAGVLSQCFIRASSMLEGHPDDDLSSESRDRVSALAEELFEVISSFSSVLQRSSSKEQLSQELVPLVTDLQRKLDDMYSLYQKHHSSRLSYAQSRNTDISFLLTSIFDLTFCKKTFGLQAADLEDPIKELITENSGKGHVELLERQAFPASSRCLVDCITRQCSLVKKSDQIYHLGVAYCSVLENLRDLLLREKIYASQPVDQAMDLKYLPDYNKEVDSSLVKVEQELEREKNQLFRIAICGLTNSGYLFDNVLILIND